MASKPFTPMLNASDSPFLRLFPNNELISVLKDSFKIRTLLAFGAFIQVLICLIFPLRWAIVPVSAILLNALITTILQIQNPSDNYSKHVVSGRTSALPPSPLTGLHGPKPSNEPLVVFHLGAQPNHPLGILAPGWKEIIEQYFGRMANDLHKRKDEYGLISMSGWKSSDRLTNNTRLLTFYFRDLEGLHKFAHDELHREGWDMYNKSKYHKNIGIFHETFVVQPGGHETMFVNAYPVLLGRGTVKSQTEDGEKYVNTLVSADVPALKTQWARLGRDATGKEPGDNF